MSGISGNVVLITGASSGIGKAVAIFLAEKGCRVYGTSRKAPSGETGTEPRAGGGFVRMLQMDVCSEDSVKDAVNQVLAAEGRIDAVVNKMLDQDAVGASRAWSSTSGNGHILLLSGGAKAGSNEGKVRITKLSEGREKTLFVFKYRKTTEHGWQTCG